MTLHIAEMLRSQREHISFHTPGHKRAGADITELSYSDCLLSPTGVLKRAEEDVAKLLGAARSFLLTDGSTCGVFSMLFALRKKGVRSVAAPIFSHPCVQNACEALGLELLPIGQKTRRGIPAQPSVSALKEAVAVADALLLTSPDYYGFLPPLAAAKELCAQAGKPLAIDGAHGSHLHFTAAHAGKFACMWVDGVHKSLPAMTQGAVVSAGEEWADALLAGVKTFRTSSPSYPIMASVEYAVKFPRNERIERAAESAKAALGAVKNDDWTKLLVPFAQPAAAQAYLEERGLYPEFNDGNYLMFYLSPCTKEEEIAELVRLASGLPRAEIAEDAPAGAVPMYKKP